MKQYRNLGIIGVLLASIIGFVFYMSEKDADTQLQNLLDERQKNLQTFRNHDASELMYAPETMAHQNLMYWGFSNNFKTVKFKDDNDLRYLHQHWTNWPLNRTTLSAQVGEHGELSLFSHYSGDELIAHNQVLVRIGNVVYDSTYIPNYASNMVSSTSSKHTIHETNHYTDTKDKEIIRRIALAESNEAIQVLIKSEHNSHAFTLSSNDKKAIADCYRLAQRIWQG